MNEKSWLFRRPSTVIACAVYLAAAILLLISGMYYSYASDKLAQQRMDILDKTMDSAVQAIQDDLETLSNVALNIRSRLRYIEMPARSELTAEQRLDLHDASALMAELLPPALLVQEAYLYCPEADYAITPDSVLETADLTRFYGLGGFAAEEMTRLHETFSLGRLIASDNGAQSTYLLSIGKDEATGAPRRQLVFLLRRNMLEEMLADIDLPEAVYTLENQLGETVARLDKGHLAEYPTRLRRALPNGCTLVVDIDDAGLHAAENTTRLIYFVTVAISLVLITGIAAVACRFSRIPIEQMINYIRRHYALPQEAQGGNLAVLRDAVEEIVENQASTQYQLQERDEAQRWEQLIHSCRQKWQGRNYVLMVFMPQFSDRSVMAEALRRVAAQADEHALLPLRDGMALMLGSRGRLLREEELCALAESLLAALDDSGTVLRAALSACHDRLEDMHIAHREARMALDCLQTSSDAPAVCFQQCDFQTGSFRLDAEYLARQQHFNRLVSQGKFTQAAQCLPTLASEMFQEEGYARSEAGRMYLDMLRYQMMSCLDYLYKDSDEDMEMRRNAIRSLLLCATTEQVTALMGQLLSEIDQPEEERDASDGESSAGDETLLMIKQYVRAHFADPQLSVTSLAEPFSMTPNALSKFFSRKAGLGVLQYIHKIRIENACNLMLNSDLTLTEIAQRVGYTNNLTFSRAFKARYRMSPSEWRRMNEGMNS